MDTRLSNFEERRIIRARRGVRGIRRTKRQYSSTTSPVTSRANRLIGFALPCDNDTFSQLDHLDLATFEEEVLLAHPSDLSGQLSRPGKGIYKEKFCLQPTTYTHMQRMLFSG